MENSYDEIKSLLEKTRRITENLENKKGSSYDVDGNTIIINRKNPLKRDLNEDEKKAFIETVDDFKLTVSSMVEFYPFNIFDGDIEWSGKILDEGIDFIISLGISNGIYIDNTVSIITDSYVETVKKLNEFFLKFKEKWSQIINS